MLLVAKNKKWYYLKLLFMFSMVITYFILWIEILSLNHYDIEGVEVNKSDDPNNKPVPYNLYSVLTVSVSVGFAFFVFLLKIRYDKLIKFLTELQAQDILREADDFIKEYEIKKNVNSI